MSEIIGQFYFKKTANGNLLGEFSNTNVDTHYTESADLFKSEKQSEFEGTYNSTWQEKGIPHFATLDITKKTSTIYRLVWSNGTKHIFTGEGFIVDNMLIGHYVSK